ncbi:MAG: DNA primase catalytic subunit PriS, partial [Candidatus Thermoplasmatota archaeon]|nr:DNA primase catalytic subunit PriS [Candidatus Thermoplasmatota archaeon]
MDSAEFLSRKFYEYYRSAKITLPERFPRREWAYIPFGGTMARHIGLFSSEQVHEFLARKVPQHAYHSAAYYQKPDAPTMAEKQWMGADLIFDLDSDHIPGAEKMSYEEQLDKVKEEFIKLVDEFLLGDFGFDPKHVRVNFSGGRGYHAHISDPRLLSLSSEERREIVDYITGVGLDIDNYVKEETVGTRGTGRFINPVKSLRMPKPDEPGWRGRISRSIIHIAEELVNSEKQAAIKRLTESGITKKTAEKILLELTPERIERIKEGNLDQTRALKGFFTKEALVNNIVALSKGETDEPVTSDVKRLIRLSDSLHGKTGLRVTLIPLDELKRFDALHDTVAFSANPVKIKVKKPMKVKLGGEQFSLKEGETEVPEFAAV